MKNERTQAHKNTISQEGRAGTKSARVQEDRRGGPTQLVRERSHTMAKGKDRANRLDGKR